ncbi:unnamed protein product [Ceratitis capitata]|uniref:(Mediterranean fruit fly) hypothetical protein n=1 Tax=Ceratitis capitata TaxID=7213 RepID=A0A811UKE9_CERCA|nr:unnamed protein product [Ceratitis capitata]
MNIVYGPDSVNERVSQKWFARFRTGNFDVKDAPGFAVCLVGLARNHLLRAATLWLNAQFGRLLPTNGPLEGSTQKRPSLINRGRIVFHQDNAPGAPNAPT